MEKKEGQKKISNLAKKIYFLSYGKPRYKLEISNMIYGRESKAIYPEIKKLEEQNWIRPVKQPKDADITRAGKRSERRQYFTANVEPFLNVIYQELKQFNISLDNIEKTKLKNFLNSPAYKEHVENKLSSYTDLSTSGDFFIFFMEILAFEISLQYNILTYQTSKSGKTINDVYNEIITTNIEKKPYPLYLEFHRLGVPLLGKLLELNPMASTMMQEYFKVLREFFIKVHSLTEETELVKKNIKEKPISSNGHGLI